MLVLLRHAAGAWKYAKRGAKFLELSLSCIIHLYCGGSSYLILELNQQQSAVLESTTMDCLRCDKAG